MSDIVVFVKQALHGWEYYREETTNNVIMPLVELR